MSMKKTNRNGRRRGPPTRDHKSTKGLPHVSFAVFIILMLALSSLPMGIGVAAGVSIPQSLSLAVAPATLPADGGSYGAIFVSLSDPNGLPTLARNDTTVFLTSSVTSVGLMLNSSVVLGPGKGYAVAYLRTTTTPGATVVTASSQGLASSQVSVKTAAPTGYPSVVALSAVPFQVVPESSYRGIVIVELEDSTGLPAKAVSDMQVRLLSSNVNVLNVTDSIKIDSGNFSVTTGFFTGFVPGNALVTATSPGFTTGSTTVSVAGQAALALKLYAQPDKMVACTAAVSSCKGRLVIALTDQNGNPARSAQTITVQLRSSNLNVIQAPRTARIAAGDISVVADYFTTSVSGNATVTASAPGLRSDTATIETSKLLPTPNALRLFVGPTPVLADHRSYSSVVVALLGSVNRTEYPTVNSTGATLVTITSSVVATGNFSVLSLVIPAGQSFVATDFTSTFLVGATSVTASAENLATSLATLNSAGAVPSSLIVSSLSQSIPADGGEHPAVEISLQNSLGEPALAPTDIPVYVSSDVGQVLQFSSPAVIPAGRSAVLLNGTTTTVTGSANITAYANLQALSPTLARSTLIRTVTPSPSSVAAFAVPAKFVLTKLQANAELAVQLQDSSGNPARARHDTLFTITSSTNGVLNGTLTAKIGQGDDMVYLALAPRSEGNTQFTVSSAGLAASSVNFAALPAPIQASFSPSQSSILQNQTATLQLSIDFEGAGLPLANVTLQASGGTVSPSIVRTNAAGSAVAVFTPSGPGLAKVTALLVHPALGDSNLTTTISVEPTPTPRQPSMFDRILVEAPVIHVPYIVFAAVAAIAVVLVFLLRRRKVEEVVGEGYEDASVS